MPLRWLITCEHASRKVPKAFEPLFCHSFEPHQWYDIGSLSYAKRLARKLSAPLFYGAVTRLLVDLNRSPESRSLFSSVTRTLPLDVREKIADTYYAPFRSAVAAFVADGAARGDTIIHISCHTFTPVWKGVPRHIDLGILFDPNRAGESMLSERLLCHLKGETAMRVRLNAPYRGTSDGHVTVLRKRFPAEQYVGIELEVNQELFAPPKIQLWQEVWFPRLLEGLRDGCRSLFL